MKPAITGNGTKRTSRPSRSAAADIWIIPAVITMIEVSAISTEAGNSGCRRCRAATKPATTMQLAARGELMVSAVGVAIAAMAPPTMVASIAAATPWPVASGPRGANTSVPMAAAIEIDEAEALSAPSSSPTGPRRVRAAGCVVAASGIEPPGLTRRV